MDLYEVADRFRAELARREARAVARLAAGYADTAVRLERRLRDLADRVAARQTDGRVPVSWLFTRGRLEQAVADVRAEARRWVDGTARPVIWQAVDHEASIGPSLAMEMVQARVRPFPMPAAVSLVRLRPDEVEQITAALQPGGPLGRLLDRVALEQADRVRDFFIDAVTANRDPRAVARDIAPLVDGGLTRSRMIVRTEMLRTTREAQRQSWQRRPQVVQGWRWWSSLDRRACVVCWAMHGTLHPLDEPFGSHPNCRCSMIPELVPAAELGLPLDDLPAPRLGVDVFAELPVGDQRRILGPGKWRAYRDGEVTLPGLVRLRRDPDWGPTRSEASLKAAGGS